MDELLSGNEATDATHKVSLAYATCLKHLRELAPSESHYSALMEVISQLESRVKS